MRRQQIAGNQLKQASIGPAVLQVLRPQAKPRKVFLEGLSNSSILNEFLSFLITGELGT